MCILFIIVIFTKRLLFCAIIKVNFANGYKRFYIPFST